MSETARAGVESDATSTGYDLTVVVACVEARRSVERCLASILAACAGLRAEIRVLDASTDGTADVVRARVPGVDLRCSRPGTLVPELWSQGCRDARGRLVAFTIGHVEVSPGWARALIAAAADAPAVGGPLRLGADAGMVARAVYFLRYSAFMPSQLGEGTVAGEIAGDNAAYWRRALERHASSIDGGFWEVDFHRRIRADGDRLVATSGASVFFIDSAPLGSMLRHRFAHGRHFAAERVAQGVSRLRIVAAAPLVPLLLAFRAARRVAGVPGYRRRFVSALPAFLALASAWAAGEAFGALGA